MGKAGSFGGDALEDVVHKRVHDAHGFAGDASVRVNLFQHFVDVDGIVFLSLSPPLFLSIRWGLSLSSSFLAFFPATLGAMSIDQNLDLDIIKITLKQPARAFSKSLRQPNQAKKKK